MNNTTLKRKLLDILETLDWDRYPETAAVIENNLSFDEEYDYLDDAFTIACELQGADASEIMPESVAKLIISIYEEEIEDDNAEAMTNLGALYYLGRAGVQDYHLACKYYTMADQHGERQATENLGYIYYYGRTGKVDYKKAYHYFAKGAFYGYVTSLYKIGDMYKNGYYVDKDEAESFRIYKHCNELMTEEMRGICGSDVYIRLGNGYQNGIGTDVNLPLALKYYQKAELHLYDRIKNGNYFVVKSLEKVIQSQNEIRALLMMDLPTFEWSK